jgi:hypothetical protein
MLRGLWWCPGLLWHGHPGPCVPTARKRLSALTALVGAMRMAAIVIDTAQERRCRKKNRRTQEDRYVLTCIIGSWLWGQRVLRGSVSLRGSNRFGITLSRLCLYDQVELTILGSSRYRQRELYKCYDQTTLGFLFYHSSCCSSNICSSEAEAEAYPTILTLGTSSLETQSVLRCRRDVYLLVSNIDICKRVYNCERQSYSAV